jgi:hypothetical protein
MFLSQADLSAAEKESIFALAKVNGQSKVIADHTYHLVAVRFDPLPLLSVSGSRGSFWIVDGEFGKKQMRPLEPKEVLKGELPPGVLLTWLRLPAKGKVEVLFGVIAIDVNATPAEVRKQLLQAGCKPFIADVSKLPAVKAESAAKLAEQMRKLGDRKPEKKP